MKPNYKQNLTHKQKFILTTQSKQALDILKMDHSEVMNLIMKSAQINPFIDISFYHEDTYDLFDTISRKKTLKEDLYYQLHTSRKPYDYEICSFIIESLDVDGFLTYNEETYCKLLKAPTEVFRNNLSILQTFDPCGVGASNMIEAMILQCNRMGDVHGAHLLTYHVEDIISKNFSKIAKSMEVSVSQIKEYISALQRCKPNPCLAYEKEFIQYVTPEVDIIVQDEEISISPVKFEGVNLNEQYLDLISENSNLKTYFQEASILFETLHKRNATLLMVVNELVQIQKGYFLYQDELNPCTLKDIAIILGINESTVSRTLAKKYFRYREEIYPFKKLFVSTSLNGDSSDRIRKALLQLIKQEDKENPLSDQQIVIKLSSMDIITSRRTIAKYRNQLKIMNSADRKQFK
ncbi:MAG: RNA polymerase factor sigma-54 [Longicatena sp.]